MLKRCTKCLLFKPLEEFYRYKRMKDGRRNECIECYAKIGSAYFKANQEKCQAYQREYRKLPHVKERVADHGRLLRMRARKAREVDARLPESELDFPGE